MLRNINHGVLCSAIFIAPTKDFGHAQIDYYTEDGAREHMGLSLRNVLNIQEFQTSVLPRVVKT